MALIDCCQFRIPSILEDVDGDGVEKVVPDYQGVQVVEGADTEWDNLLRWLGVAVSGGGRIPGCPGQRELLTLMRSD
ncbi:MAG: hypothetical protein P8N76_15235 [Pirellulaceae bacterium]|nr:hypothetical protein [Pirellulaceae bacterium]